MASDESKPKKPRARKKQIEYTLGPISFIPIPQPGAQELLRVAIERLEQSERLIRIIVTNRVTGESCEVAQFDTPEQAAMALHNMTGTYNRFVYDVTVIGPSQVEP